MLKLFIALLVIAPQALACLTHQRAPAYYGHLQWNNSQELKQKLHLVVAGGHTPRENDVDLIEPKCSNSKCYTHLSSSYRKARERLFGFLHLEELFEFDYSLTSFYCRQKFTKKDFPYGSALGPYKIPNHKVLNTEHSWPQSKFNDRFPKEYQKTDLHALFPVISRVNSIRGNRPYGEVVEMTSDVCDNAFYGDSSENQRVFEPSDDIKGDIARAIFYFSIRYDIAIDRNQENYLRKWHYNDPVDQTEELRNEHIYDLQLNRNPFVDLPYLVGEIDNF